MDDLLAGYRRFRQSSWPERRATFEALSEHGQRPRAMVIACMDSRVDPSAIFDTAPGQVLTVRNVANLVPPYMPDAAFHGTSAAVEFGVRVLGVSDLVVLGHGQCGGAAALLHGVSAEAGDFVADWMSIGRAARDVALRCEDPAEQERCCELELVRVSLVNLRGFPWIAEREAAGTLALHGAWFAIRTGELALLQPDGSFAPC